MTQDTRELVEVIGKLGGHHPADGLTANVNIGDGAVMSIINPQSFAEGGPAWRMIYGDPIGIRFAVASLLDSYDYLLSANITSAEAIARLRVMRRARAALAGKGEA